MGGANIADQTESSSDDNSAIVLTSDSLREPFRDCFVIAPRQFGLSSLGRYLALSAWKSKPRKFARNYPGTPPPDLSAC